PPLSPPHAPTPTSPLSLHDALPISHEAVFPSMPASAMTHVDADHVVGLDEIPALISRLVREPVHPTKEDEVSDEAPRENAYSALDRKSTRLNSSHRTISYAVFCLKK